MTLDEMLGREGIRRTIAAYTVAGDRLRADDFIALFTEDAVIESEGVPEADLFRYAGRPAIAGWIARWRTASGPADRVHRASFIRHHLATCAIELTAADTARARTYWVAWTDIGADHAGHYLDDFRREGDRWLIAHRRIRLDWRAPDSLFLDAVARAR